MRVAVGDLGDGDALVHRGLQVGVVGADAGGDDELELLRLVEALLGHVGRPERLRDHDLGVGQLLLEGSSSGRPCRRSRPACGRPSRGTCASPSSPDTLPSSSPGLKSMAARGRRRLAVGIVVDLGDVVAGIFRRIAVDRVVVENSKTTLAMAPLLFIGRHRRTTSIASRARTSQRPAAMSLLHWIKAERATRIRLVLSVSSPAGAVVRASSRLPTVGTFAMRLTQDQVATL